MCDGSLQNDKKCIILHTQNFSEKENIIWSNEFNFKLNWNTKVISHKKIYYVIITKSTDALQIACLITKYMIARFVASEQTIASMGYKIPKQS